MFVVVQESGWSAIVAEYEGMWMCGLQHRNFLNRNDLLLISRLECSVLFTVLHVCTGGN